MARLGLVLAACTLMCAQAFIRPVQLPALSVARTVSAYKTRMP